MRKLAGVLGHYTGGTDRETLHLDLGSEHALLDVPLGRKGYYIKPR